MGNREFDYTYRLAFLCEWYDYDSQRQRNFHLTFFPCDDTLELFDRDFKKAYLRRTKCENVTMAQVFVGNTIRVYDRQLFITDYADCKTRQFVGNKKDHTFALIKPSAMARLGDVIGDIERHHFQIVRMRMANLTRKETLTFYEAKKGDPFLPFTIEHIVSGSVVALELVGENAVQRLMQLIGPENSQDAQRTDPDSLRAKYGVDRACNAIDVSTTHEEAMKNACFFFPQGVEGKSPPTTTVRIKNSTCCIVKPHAIAEGKLGPILTLIMSKFKISAMQMFYLTAPNAEEFLEVYKGVVSDFHALLSSFLDGPCIALEISSITVGHDTDVVAAAAADTGARPGDAEDVHGEFRKFAGPPDSDIARQIRPNTLRAIFGSNKYRNAVHCTDLKEDAVLELEYFFKILES